MHYGSMYISLYLWLYGTIESMIEQFWAALEHAQEVLEELFAFYIEVEDNGKNEAFKSQKPSKKTYKERSKRGKMRSNSAHAKS